MDFSVSTLNKMEDNVKSTLRSVVKEVKVQSVEELSPTILGKLNKGPMSKMVIDLAKLIKKNVRVCKAAAAKIDELKTEKLADQKSLIDCQQKQLESVKTAVKTEMKSWSDIVKTNVSQAPSDEVIKKVVRKTVEQNDRDQSFIIHGAVEDGEKTPEEIVEDVFLDLKKQDVEGYSPCVLAVGRIGTKKPGVSNSRPIKVTLNNPDDVRSVLKRSSLLKKSPEEYFRKLYLAPDRTLEERKERQKLVSELKNLIESEPGKYHFIKNKQVMSTDKNSSASDDTQKHQTI